jgi:MoaA/NifB/PqqE/SkfB family radical SAM enzyme
MTLHANWLYKRGYDAVNFRLRRMADGRFAGHCRPVTINLLLTERCQARCLHCDIWKNTGREETPSVEELKRTLQEIRRWLGPVQITITGGEALLKPYAIELIRYAVSLELIVEVLTNGYWPQASKIEQLALADPWRITISLDGIGAAHDRIRGREDFFQRTNSTIELLCNLRRQQKLGYAILLKTVIMEHNLAELGTVARYADEHGVEVLYQPIEQNYNTADDPEWFDHTQNWPHDLSAVRAAVLELKELKQQRLPIVNSCDDLDAILKYFEDPRRLGVAVRAHVAPTRASLCAAITNMQIQANGDVRVCSQKPPVGNIRESSIRTIWEKRPQFWKNGCCRS